MTHRKVVFPHRCLSLLIAAALTRAPRSVCTALLRCGALLHLGVAASCAAPSSSVPASSGATGIDSLHLVREYEIDRPDPALLVQSVDQVELLSEDRLMIRDGGLRRVIIVTEAGAVERSFGRVGGGPGEFQWMSDVVRMRGDSVLVADGRAGRLTVFDGRGVVARMFELRVETPAPTTPLPIAQLTDGRLAFVAPHLAIPDGASDRMRHYTGVYLGEAAATALDLIALVPSQIQFVEGTARWGSILFSPAAHVAVRDDQIFLAVSDSSHITVVDLVTGDERTVLHGIPPRAVTPAMIAAERERRRQAPINVPPFAHEARRMQQDAIERQPSAEILPAFNGIVVDPHHRVWATACDPIDEARCVAYVVDRDGGILAVVPLPPRFVLHEVARDRLVGVADYDDRGRVIEVRALPEQLMGAANAGSVSRH